MFDFCFFSQSEATAKRLTYGDYVRASTKEGSLQNPVKPSPWSDFMDMKKGNVYHLSREEKVRDLRSINCLIKFEFSTIRNNFTINRNRTANASVIETSGFIRTAKRRVQLVTRILWSKIIRFGDSLNEMKRFFKGFSCCFDPILFVKGVRIG